MSSDGEQEQAQLFRLWVRRGQRFTLQVPGNPPVTHNGGLTVAPLVMPSDRAESVRRWIESQGCEVDLLPAVQQSDLQAEERGVLLGLNDPNRVFPCVKCPKCSWFDPLLKGEPCGRLGWEESYREAHLQAHEKAVEDAESCPAIFP